MKQFLSHDRVVSVSTLYSKSAFFDLTHVLTVVHMLPCLSCTVLVDEASMLDVQLMAALLRALPPGCQLVLVCVWSLFEVQVCTQVYTCLPWASAPVSLDVTG